MESVGTEHSLAISAERSVALVCDERRQKVARVEVGRGGSGVDRVESGVDRVESGNNLELKVR